MKKIVMGLAAMFAASPAAADAQKASSFAYSELKEGRIRSGVSGSDRPGALYQAGSISKYVCTIAILRLADQGRVEIDRPLESILPQLEGQGAAKVTVRQLLANRSGLPDNLMPNIKRDMKAVLAVRSTFEAIRKFTFGDLVAEPGTRYSYDLVNWIVVQAVLEKVAGNSLSKALEEVVFRPAGLNHTMVFSGSIGPGAQAPAEPMNALPAFLQCAGGIASTPSELIALLRFANKGGLSQKSLQAIRTVTTPEENYTLGGHVRTVGDRLFDWKTGSNGAYKSVAVYDPAKDAGFAAMSAQDDWEAINGARDSWIAAGTSTGRKAALAPSTAVPPERWVYVGDRQNDHEEYVDTDSISRVGDKVTLWTRRDYANEGATAWKELEFDCTARTETVLAYIRDDRGVVSHNMVRPHRAAAPIPPASVEERIFDIACVDAAPAGRE